MNDSEIECLKNELEHEKTFLHIICPQLLPLTELMAIYTQSILEIIQQAIPILTGIIETAAWQNGELEKKIVSMQEELRKTEFPWECDEDLQKENHRHKQLLDSIEALRAQLPVLKEKIRSAKVCGPDCKLKHDDLNINLDVLTPMELLRTVKRFERLKTDLLSTLRSKEWRLDSESKLFVRLNDQRTYLQNELMICQNNIMRLQRNSSYWQNVPRKDDERVLDPRRGPIKKIFGAERLPPIATK